VPFFFARGPAWVTGIGEQVAPLVECRRVWLVLVYPGIFLSTAKVFSQFRRGLTSPMRPPTIAQFNFRGLVGRLFNDLQAPAVAAEPAIGEALDALGRAGAAERLMSGSGSAVFGVFDRAAAARAAAARVAGHPRAADWQIEVVSTLPPGAFPFPAG
jgi:4-diphosphocytidyl-2-C-methyl-D-erythritol kinase